MEGPLPPLRPSKPYTANQMKFAKKNANQMKRNHKKVQAQSAEQQ
jgi:hypothetical protein